MDYLSNLKNVEEFDTFKKSFTDGEEIYFQFNIGEFVAHDINYDQYVLSFIDKKLEALNLVPGVDKYEIVTPEIVTKIKNSDKDLYLYGSSELLISLAKELESDSLSGIDNEQLIIESINNSYLINSSKSKIYFKEVIVNLDDMSKIYLSEVEKINKYEYAHCINGGVLYYYMNIK